MDVKNVLAVSAILFAVIDVIGSVPVILAVQNRVGTVHPLKATLVSLLIMVGFLFVGENILYFLGVDVSSFAIAGSLVLFFLAMEMILGVKLYKDELPGTASVVPIAFPLIAGTGTMTTLLSLRSTYDVQTILLAIFLNIVLVYIVLRNLGFIEKLFGPGGINIVRKVFGIVLLAIAIKLFRTNLNI